jgi:hypothetical protein
MAREAASTTCREAEALLSSVAYLDSACLRLV